VLCSHTVRIVIAYLINVTLISVSVFSTQLRPKLVFAVHVVGDLPLSLSFHVI